MPWNSNQNSQVPEENYKNRKKQVLKILCSSLMCFQIQNNESEEEIFFELSTHAFMGLNGYNLKIVTSVFFHKILLSG